MFFKVGMNENGQWRRWLKSCEARGNEDNDQRSKVKGQRSKVKGQRSKVKGQKLKEKRKKKKNALTLKIKSQRAQEINQ